MKFNIFMNPPTFRLWAGTVLVFGMMASTLTAMAQEKADNPALLKVVYEFTHVDDSTQRDRPVQEEMNLYINSTSSLYRRFSEEDSEYHRHRQRGGVPKPLISTLSWKTHHPYIILFKNKQWSIRKGLSLKCSKSGNPCLQLIGK